MLDFHVGRAAGTDMNDRLGATFVREAEKLPALPTMEYRDPLGALKLVRQVPDDRVNLEPFVHTSPVIVVLGSNQPSSGREQQLDRRQDRRFSRVAWPDQTVHTWSGAPGQGLDTPEALDSKLVDLHGRAPRSSHGRRPTRNLHQHPTSRPRPPSSTDRGEVDGHETPRPEPLDAFPGHLVNHLPSGGRQFRSAYDHVCFYAGSEHIGIPRTSCCQPPDEGSRLIVRPGLYKFRADPKTRKCPMDQQAAPWGNGKIETIAR